MALVHGMEALRADAAPAGRAVQVGGAEKRGRVLMSVPGVA